MHTTTIKVRGFHLDINGHVNNARYLEFLEAARWDFLEAHGLGDTIVNGTHALVVTHIDISYRQPATLGDSIVIESTMRAVRSRSATVHQVVRLVDSGRISAEALVTFMVFNSQKQTAVRIDGPLRDTLTALTES
jgi:thioesterase-3